ncbi:hypothetical protein J1N35_027768 [Gossypium stocksii]|uniref:Endonuclease/exonuclease/phosphatase domain-containing protein n=1 Tax=Gossypium stocksii TaxID=47602 RepID=A0A9D3VAW7_9ROSI|nr:hypothetical protein J1N35_027768 [Gossypium stocksii]
MAHGGSSRNNGKLGKEIEPAFGPWMLVEHKSRWKLGDSRESDGKIEGKGRLGSKFDALTNKGEMVGGEREMAKEDSGGLNSHAMEFDLITLDSKDKGFFKPLPNSHIRSNGSLVGPHTKTNPISLYLQDCSTEAYQPISCASLKLRVVAESMQEVAKFISFALSNKAETGVIVDSDPSGLNDLADLHDLGFRGPPFTWHKGNMFERLDRALGNKAWINYFPISLITYLPKIKSDHRPLLLNLNPVFALPRGILFQFSASWVEHPDFFNFMKDQWEFQGNMETSLNKITENLKDWNKNIYGHITYRKRNLIHKLSTTQKQIDLLGANHLALIEIEIRHELENVLHYEELLWRQKARCNWLHLGDRNTKFFHARTLQQRRKIVFLLSATFLVIWLFDPKAIEVEAFNFFQKLYGEDPRPMRSVPTNGFPQIYSIDIDFLGRVATD